MFIVDSPQRQNPTRTARPRGQYCMDAPGNETARHDMPLELSDAELSTAATACRALAYQEGERAQAMRNPDMRRQIESTAHRFASLAAKFEAARKGDAR